MPFKPLKIFNDRCRCYTRQCWGPLLPAEPQQLKCQWQTFYHRLPGWHNHGGEPRMSSCKAPYCARYDASSVLATFRVHFDFLIERILIFYWRRRNVGFLSPMETEICREWDSFIAQTSPWGAYVPWEDSVIEWKICLIFHVAHSFVVWFMRHFCLTEKKKN